MAVGWPRRIRATPGISLTTSTATVWSWFGARLLAGARRRIHRAGRGCIGADGRSPPGRFCGRRPEGSDGRIRAAAARSRPASSCRRRRSPAAVVIGAPPVVHPECAYTAVMTRTLLASKHRRMPRPNPSAGNAERAPALAEVQRRCRGAARRRPASSAPIRSYAPRHGFGRLPEGRPLLNPRLRLARKQRVSPGAGSVSRSNLHNCRESRPMPPGCRAGTGADACAAARPAAFRSPSAAGDAICAACAYWWHRRRPLLPHPGPAR